MINFREVNIENFQTIIDLQLTEDQTGFLESNLHSLAEAKVDSRLVPLGIYDGELAVGFLMYYFEANEEPKYVYLKRLMIAKEHQGKSYGKAALLAALEFFREKYPIACVELMHYPDNVVGAALYQQLGFAPTGELWGTEIIRRRYY